MKKLILVLVYYRDITYARNRKKSYGLHRYNHQDKKEFTYLIWVTCLMTGLR